MKKDKTLGDMEKEAQRIIDQSIAEWIAEYSGEPVKTEKQNNADENQDNFGVEY